MFAPGDIDLDSRFQLIAEFRDAEQTAKIRVDDFILDKIFQSMAKDGLQIDEGVLIRTLTQLGHQASYLKGLREFAWRLGVPIAPALTSRIMSTIVVVQQTKEAIYKNIEPALEAYIRENGISTPPRLIYQLVEKTLLEKPVVLKYFTTPRRTNIHDANRNEQCRSNFGN
jgi:hypothetical protein